MADQIGLVVPQRGRPRSGHADPPPWRFRARRGRHAGCLRSRAHAVAERRHPGQSARLARQCRPPQGDRPAAAPHALSGQARTDRSRADVRASDWRMDPGRASGGRRVAGRRLAANLHLLPSGLAGRSADRFDAAHDLRTDDRGDRQGLFGHGKDHGAAAGARENQDPRCRYPLRGAFARHDRRAARTACSRSFI